MPERTDPTERPAGCRTLIRRRRSIALLTSLVLAVLGYGGIRWLQGLNPPLAGPTPATQADGASPAGPGRVTLGATAGPRASGSASATSATEASTPAIRSAPAMPTTLPESGTGSTSVLQLPGTDSQRDGRRVRYTVEVEGGLRVPEQHFAAAVREVLTDPRGWEAQDGVHFVNVTPAQRAEGAAAEVRIILGSPAYVDDGCLPLRTMGNLSCHSRGKVLLNVRRWAQGADTYDDVTAYRTYLINHEVGHAIGHSHRACPGRGRPAPVMVQQTKSLYGCEPWPWPQPPTG